MLTHLKKTAEIAASPAYQHSRQRGAVAIIVAITIPVLIGFMGLALDLGKLYVAKTELQSGADACALSASRALTGTDNNQLTIAEDAGIATGIRNNVLFQSESVNIPINSAVTFSQTLNGSYQVKFVGAGALPMKFARCTVSRAGIATWFMQVLNVMPGVNIGTQTVAATAVATLAPSPSSCLIPVGICSADIAGKPVGTWVEGVLGPHGSKTDEGNLTGSYKWIDFSPPAGGASEVSGILSDSTTCTTASIGQEVGENGVKSSVSKGWNSRFGIYNGNVKADGTAVPDFTGYGYTERNWTTKFNALGDYQAKRGFNTQYQDNAAVTGIKLPGGSDVKNSTYLAANGADRRLAAAPVVNCSAFAGATAIPILSFACVLMLHPLGKGNGTTTGETRMYLEYLGDSSNPASPCASTGGAGTGSGALVTKLVQ